MEAKHLSTDELESGLPQIKQSPKESGELQLIARRPAIGERDLIDEGELDTDEGLVGDNWATRGQQSDPPREPKLLAQLTLMNARAAQLV
ncbi:MAG: MOSC domain-containing protein, partial [Candidatus Latescibacteria bacterium]|nr:MOSC domain-containing protein [Candidatus Latescibacterota bacterium]